jgi:hypothetical protein
VHSVQIIPLLDPNVEAVSVKISDSHYGRSRIVGSDNPGHHYRIREGAAEGDPLPIVVHDNLSDLQGQI